VTIQRIARARRARITRRVPADEADPWIRVSRALERGDFLEAQRLTEEQNARALRVYDMKLRVRGKRRKT
jgi:hypothetical protein